jgi:hypothetical protein
MKAKWLFEDSTKLPHPLCNFAFHCAEVAKNSNSFTPLPNYDSLIRILDNDFGPNDEK